MMAYNCILVNALHTYYRNIAFQEYHLWLTLPPLKEYWKVSHVAIYLFELGKLYKEQELC